MACQLDSLRDCFNLSHVRQALESLPRTLDDTYARILCNIDLRYSHYNRHTLKMFQWLTFSFRPLKLEELAEIVAIDVDETPRFDPERRWPEPREILMLCSSLITLTNASGEGSGSAPDEQSQDMNANSKANIHDSEDSSIYVRLAHFSVKEYLVSNRIQHGAAPHYSIRDIESHGVLAADCLAYLLQFDEPGSLTLDTLRLSPLANYAAEFWTYHAKRAERGPIKSATLLTFELFVADGEAYLNWTRIFSPDLHREDLIRGLEDLAPSLYYASTAGLFEPTKMLIKRGMNVNAGGGFHGSALQAASHWGHVDVVQLLLDSGADVNAGGGYWGGALQAASWDGNENVVKLLLDKGADVNAVGGTEGSALQLASEKGNERVVKLLLDKGADVNAGSVGALLAASEKGNENVVKLLLDRGADVNAVGRFQGSLLQAASEKGYERVAKLLLDNGADANAVSGGSGSALQAASQHGHENVVKMLLDRGADVNAVGGYWGGALQVASWSGNEIVVKLLLDRGADVNAVGGYWGGALPVASWTGNENVVKLLLDKGADVNAVGGIWGGALQVASQRGHEDVVKMLLARGAVMPKEGSSGGGTGDAPMRHVGELDDSDSLAVAD